VPPPPPSTESTKGLVCFIKNCGSLAVPNVGLQINHLRDAGSARAEAGVTTTDHHHISLIRRPRRTLNRWGMTPPPRVTGEVIGKLNHWRKTVAPSQCRRCRRPGHRPARFLPVTSTAELQAATFKRGTKIRLVDDVAGYEAGTSGKIALANGVTWKRYWVRMSNGSAVGHISHSSVVKAKDYDTFLVSRDREAIEAENAAAAAALSPAASSDGGGDADAAGSGGVEINGVFLAQSWLDKAAAARARLGG